MRRYFWLAILLCSIPLAFAQDTHNTVPSALTSTFNTDNQTFLTDEDADRYADIHAPVVVSGCLGSTSGSKVMAAFACTGYTDTGYFVNQPSAAIDFGAALCADDDTAWVIATKATDTALSGNFSRVAGTRYAVDCTSTAEPSAPTDSLMLMQVVIASAAITDVVDQRRLGLFMPARVNTHGETDPIAEQRRRESDMFNGHIVAGCNPTTATVLTLDTVACTGYVVETNELFYVDQATSTIGPLSGGNGTYWIALYKDPSSVVAGWTREANTHYLWQLSGTRPATPDGGLLIAQVEVSAGAIGDIIDLRILGVLLPERPNTHGTTALDAEMREVHNDTMDPFIASGCTPAVPSSSLTIAAFACQAYVVNGTELTYVDQAAATVTVANNTPIWLAIHKDTYTAVAGWTREANTHFISQQNASRPADPAGAVVFAQVTVAANVISAITRLTPGASVPGCTHVSRYPTIADAIADATAGDTLCFNGSETITGLLTINKALTLEGHGGTLTFSTDATNQGVRITASDVTIRGLTIVGPQEAAVNISQFGIQAQGADVNNYINNIKIYDTDVSNFGNGCIEMNFVEDFLVQGNRVKDCYHSGISALQSKHGIINANRVIDIDADGVVGTNAYGIQISKDTGTEAARPLSHHVAISNNVISGCTTWKGIDTHGGHEIAITGNTIIDCRRAINLVSYISTAGDELGPVNITVSGNMAYTNHAAGEVIVPSDMGSCIGVNGDFVTLALGESVTVTGNTCDGYGDSNSTEAAFQAQYISGLTVSGNIFRNNTGTPVSLLSINGLTMTGNGIYAITDGTAGTAATNTITCSGLPVAAETVTINESVWTWRAAAAADYEVTIGADGDGSCTNLANAIATNAEQDGRVDDTLFTVADNTGSITLTSAEVGTIGNHFTASEASTNVEVSSANFTGGVANIPVFHLKQLSGSGIRNTGLIANNHVQATGHVVFYAPDDQNALHFRDNLLDLGTTPYDMDGSGAQPLAGGGSVDVVSLQQWTYDPPSIADTASDTFYIPAPGIGQSSLWRARVFSQRVLEGLTLSAIPDGDGGWVKVILYNDTGGAIDIGSTVWTAEVSRVAQQ